MSILVVVEQREGKLNRVSWETLTAGQAVAADSGWPLEAAVLGDSVAAFAAEIARKKSKTRSSNPTRLMRLWLP